VSLQEKLGLPIGGLFRQTTGPTTSGEQQCLQVILPSAM